MTRSVVKPIRDLVRREVARALAAQPPRTKRQPIPCGTGVRNNWPRCMGSAVHGSGGCTCGSRNERIEREATLLIAWIAARGSDDERVCEIAEEIGAALGIRSKP